VGVLVCVCVRACVWQAASDIAAFGTFARCVVCGCVGVCVGGCVCGRLVTLLLLVPSLCRCVRM